MKTNRTLAILTSLFALLGATTQIEAADFVATTSGNWALGATWGNPGNNVVNSGFPGAGDTATIDPGVFVTNAVAAACTTLTVNGTLAANQALTVSGNTLFSSTGAYLCTTATGTRTFTGDVQLDNGAAWSSTAAGPCSFGGNLVNNATSFSGNGTYTFTGASKSISGATTTALTAMSVSGSYTSSGTVTVSGTLTLAGTLLNDGTFSFGGSSGAGTLTQGTGANLTFTQSNGTAPSFTMAATASGNTVTYSGSGSPIKSTTYHHLTLSGSGSPSATWASIVVNGTCTIGGTVTANNFSGTFGALTVSGGSPTANAVVNVTGNLLVSSGTFYAQTGGLNVTGTTTVSGGTLRPGGTAAFTGDFLLNGGTYNNTGNAAASFAGNLTYSSGTITTFGTGPNTFSGTGKTISGTIPIPRVTVTGTYAVSGTLTVSTALVLASGGLTSANNVTMANAATIIRLTGTLDAAPAFGTTVNVAYGGATAASTGPEIPTSTTVLSAFTVTNTSAGGITLGANITANGVCTIGAGAKLNVPTTMEIKSTLPINASGLVVVSSGGSLKNSGTSSITSTAATLTFASGAMYLHNPPSGGGSIPTAGWNAGSTCKIIGTLSSAPGGLAQVFGNFTWDTTTQSSAIGLAGALTNVSGTLTVANTGSGLSVRLASTQSPVVNIGALTVSGGELDFSSSSGVPTVNVGGDVNLSGGTLRPATSSGVPVFNVGGNWTNSGGAFTPGTGTVTLNGGSAQIIGGSTSTTFSNLTLNNSAGLTLATGPTVSGTLTLTSGAISSAGNLTLGDGATIARDTGTLDAAPTFGTTVNVSYIGATAVNTSSEIPASSTVLNNLTINKSGGVTLTGSPTVNGTLALTTGSLSSAASLALANGATISRDTGTLDAAPAFGTTVNVSYTGASAANTSFEIPVGASVLNNLTINKSGGVTLGANATANGTLTLTSGSFDVGANTLTLNGPTIAGTPANLTTTSSSTLVFGGSSVGVNVPSSVTALNGLAINNASDVTLNSSPTVAGTLTLTSGKVQAGANTLGVSSAGTVAGGSSSSYVNGTLQKAFNTGAGQAFTFPIGDATVYAPVALSGLDVTGADTLTATTTASQHPQIATSSIDPAKDVQRYWTLTPGGGLTVSTYAATFDFVAADVIGGAAPASFIVERYSGGTWFTNIIGTLTSTSSQATGLASFGDFAVGEAVGGGPTPTGSTIASVSLAGNLLSLTITNGLANGVFNLLESTNVLFAPFTTNQSGTFDGSGNANVTVTNMGGNNFLRVAEPTP